MAHAVWFSGPFLYPLRGMGEHNIFCRRGSHHVKLSCLGFFVENMVAEKNGRGGFERQNPNEKWKEVNWIVRRLGVCFRELKLKCPAMAPSCMAKRTAVDEGGDGAGGCFMREWWCWVFFFFFLCFFQMHRYYIHLERRSQSESHTGHGEVAR